eukprot:16446163-Heterocapsa_arctica.AAC.1
MILSGSRLKSVPPFGGVSNIYPKLDEPYDCLQPLSCRCHSLAQALFVSFLHSGVGGRTKMSRGYRSART